MIDALKDGSLRDVSIGFTYDEDKTPGEFKGKEYDIVQRNIFIDHVATAIPKGRCPSPYCGLGFDEAFTIQSRTSTMPPTTSTTNIQIDPWEETEKQIRSGHRSPDDFDPDSFRTINITEGVNAVVACPKGSYEDGECQVGMQVQSYIFDKSMFNLSEAKAWYKEHKADAMTLEEVNAKIESLRMQKAEIEDKLEEYYAAQTHSRDPELTKLYEQLDDLVREITAWQEAKVAKIVGKDGDCVICEEMKNLGLEASSFKLAKAFGKDAVLGALKDEEEDDGLENIIVDLKKDIDNKIQSSRALIARTDVILAL
jgi:hypothetical protein